LGDDLGVFVYEDGHYFFSMGVMTTSLRAGSFCEPVAAICTGRPSAKKVISPSLSGLGSLPPKAALKSSKTEKLSILALTMQTP